MSRSRKALAGFFAFAGTMHFVIPRSYESIVPPWLTLRREAVVVSGVAEIAGAAAILSPASRRFARWWLLGLLAAVFPANVHMALHPEQVHGARPQARPALGALGAAAAAAAGDVVGLAGDARLSSAPRWNHVRDLR